MYRFILIFVCVHSLNYFSISGPMKSDISDLNVPHGKMSDFVLFQLFGFTWVIKLRNVGFESHLNTSIFFDEKYMTTDLNMSCGKMSDFASFPLFVLTLALKLRNFDF